MTGNVNIYICSEATENAQPTKSKKQQPCAESSSETTTGRSDLSSSKLVTCIRNKRRKFKEQTLSKKDESSDNSSSLVSKSITESEQDLIDVCKQISEKDTESTLTECECKDSSDATIASDQSLRRTKFVVCDAVEKPCSTIYPLKASSKSESEEWSSKSVRSSRDSSLETLRTVCDKKRGPELGYNNYYQNNLKEDYESKRKVMSACRCRKNREQVGGCSCGEKRRRKENLKPSTCACIAEEEEDVCNDEDCQKLQESVCQNVERTEEQIVPCTEGVKEKVEEEKPEEDEPVKEDAPVKKDEPVKIEPVEETKEPSPLTPRRLVRPEVVVLKNILKQTKPPAQTNPGPAKVTSSPSSNPSNSQVKNEPAFMKKFNLREQYKFMKRPDAEETTQKVEEEESKAPSKEEEESKAPPKEKEESKAPSKEEEAQKNPEDNVARRSFSERMKGTLFYKTFRKVVDKASPDRKNGKEEKDAIEDTDTEKKEEKTDVDQREDSKESKGKFMNIYKIMKSKRSKKNSNEVTLEKNSEKDESKAVPMEEKNVPQEEEKDVQEGSERRDKKKDEKEEKEKSAEVIIENEDKVKSITPVTKPSSIKDIKIEEEKKDKKTERVIEPQEAKIEDREIRKKFDQSKKEEMKKPVEERPKRIDTHSEATVCAQCIRRKSQKESKHFVAPPRMQTLPSEPHTTCINTKFTRCDVNNNYPNESFNESRCNCCYLPISQCTNEFVSHPKSCLKKERQFRCVNSQENSSVLCCDKRNWEECGCRRVVLCEGCRRPRTECW
nr:PREDICTED: neurofilament heavy polypeptide-like [Megachile rotundata]